jgi:hypothetical protein
MKTKYAQSISKLLRCCPELENITQEKHKKKGTIVLLNKEANRKYYIFKSGFAKAVNADDGCLTDFINAWSCDWRNCYPYSKSMLISLLHQYVEYHRNFKRKYIFDYNIERKGEEEKVWSSIHKKWIPKSESMWS